MEKLFNGFFTGINYWGCKSATNMWEDYDPADIAADLDAMKAAGVTHLRVFPMWAVFQPLTALYTTSMKPYEFRFGEERLPDTPAGRAGVSEEACRMFENFCDLVEERGLKLIVGLITGHMSFREFAPPAFAGRHRLSDPTVLKWQLRFVRYFVGRFKDRKGIVGWDLGNEVNNMAHTPDFEEDDFYVWCSAIADAIRASDGTRPVVSGMDASSISRRPDNLITVRETCDVHTCHPYNIFATRSDPLPTMKPISDLIFKCRMYEDVSEKPTFVQEFGSIGYMNCSKKTEADFYRACLYACLSHGCHGVMWWCAFDQGHHRFAPYNWNNIGSDYGFCDRNRQPKPIAEENLKFHELLKKLPGGELPAHATDGVILIPRDNGDANNDTLRAAFMLGKRANLDFRFSYAVEAIPDSPLYILPSVSSNQTIPADRLDTILSNVEKGSVFFMSIGEALFRQIPEIFGVNIAWREIAPAHKDVTFGGEVLPVDVPVSYTIESAEADVLATDAQGNPVFFVKQHGKGRVFLLLMPLEKFLAQKQGAFYAENEPAYDLVYRELAKAANVQRVADSDCPFVRLTEHPVDENTRYVVAVNYSQYPRKAKITLKGGTLEPFHGANVENGVLKLRENDGAVFVWHK